MIFNKGIGLVWGVRVDPDISKAMNVNGYCDVWMIEDALNCLALRLWKSFLASVLNWAWILRSANGAIIIVEIPIDIHSSIDYFLAAVSILMVHVLPDF